MYEQHFGLTQRPFSIAPDPRFLYMSPQHREALAHLLYGVGEGGGFVQLTGEVGTGKTTICRCLLEQLPEDVDIALILNPRVTALELVASLCDELHIKYAKDTTSIKALTDVLNACLLESHARGRRTVLMIDEAQSLSAEALEQVRLFTNLETTREKLLQIILVGQPELRVLLARDDLRQLSQRITARYHLEPISRDETAEYIRHRLQICGSNDPVFSDQAVDLVHKLSEGVPRLINVLCDRAMLGAFVEGKHRVEPGIVHKAAREVLPEEGLDAPASKPWRWIAAAVVALAVAAGIFLGRQQSLFPSTAEILIPRPSVDVQPSTEVATAAPVTQVVELSPVEASDVVDEQDFTGPVLPSELPAPEQPSESPAKPELQPAPELQPSPLATLLGEASADASAHAWSGLYRLWGYQSDAVTDKDACRQAPSAGLRCLQGGGSWAIVRRFNRPTVLLLVGDEGRRVPVLLKSLVSGQVQLEIDGQSLQVPIGVLEQYWYGEYRLLWKTPPSGASALRPGQRNKDVRWLRDRLQQVTGSTSIAPDPQRYDAGLKELVQSFQRSQHLTADGVAGARTLIRLNNLDSDPELPRLDAVGDSLQG